MRTTLAPISICLMLLVACSGDPPRSSPRQPEAEALDAFDVWRALQQVLRQSPDHRAARATQLVQGGDPEQLFAFVRDEIALVPGSGGFYGSEIARRWGTAATLRGGMGTMRERADLLAELLQRAGHAAEVWTGAPQPAYDLPAALAHAPVRAVEWPVDAEARAEWRAILGISGDGTRTRFDPGATVQQEIAATGGAFSVPLPPPLDFVATGIPFVRATIGGQAVDFNPNVAAAPSGQAAVLDPAPAPPADPLPPVTVRLEAARASAPQAPFLLVERTWTADELVGRTVTAAFASPLSFARAANTAIGDVETFVPMLVVRGADLPREARAALSAVGAPITRGGEVVEVAGDGALMFPDGAVPAPPSSPAQLARVVSVSARADAATFPQVVIQATLRDAGGAAVPGLAADAFRLSEDGVAVVGHLRRVEARTPRVLVLFDRSASMPAAFLDDAPAVGHAIAEALFAALPGSEVQFGGLDFGAPTLAGGFVDNLADADAALTQLTGAGSEIWLDLAAVAEITPAQVVVCISDFAAEDARTPELDALIAAGPAVLAVGVGSFDAATAAAVAALSDGASQAGVAAGDVAAAAAAFALARAGADYELVYRSPGAPGVTHTVSVEVDNQRVLGSATYTAPASPVRPPALAGLYLTVETSGRVLRRTLAGTSGPTVTEADLAAVRGMLFGRAVLAVEAGPPGLSAKLDEVIGERFVLEPVIDAIDAGDEAALWSALEVPRTRTPWRLRFAFSAGPGEAIGPVTYPDGLQLALAVERPTFGVGVTVTLDLLPIVERRTALADPAAAQLRTLQRTSYLAAIEARTFPRSTYSLLRGESLTVVDPLFIDAVLGPQWLEPVSAYRDDYTIIAPADGDPVAFWAVRASGALLGGLPDGSGGAIEAEVEQMLQEVNTVLDAAERAGEMVGFEGISVWVELERLKAALVGNATVIIAGGAGVDPMDIVVDAAADAARDAIEGEIPGLDELTGPVDDLGSIYDLAEVITGEEMPDVELP